VVTRAAYLVTAADADAAAQAVADDGDDAGQIIDDDVEITAGPWPQLLLPTATSRQYKVEWRYENKVIFERVMVRTNVHEVRDKAAIVSRALVDMGAAKCAPSGIEIRIRELGPSPVLWRWRYRSALT
jgi:hypothetical protein